jgi:hypothetical protein
LRNTNADTYSYADNYTLRHANFNTAAYSHTKGLSNTKVSPDSASETMTVMTAGRVTPVRAVIVRGGPEDCPPSLQRGYRTGESANGFAA